MVARHPTCHGNPGISTWLGGKGEGWEGAIAGGREGKIKTANRALAIGKVWH